jgi:hypothetical protein
VRWEVWLVGLAALYYLIRLLYFALAIAQGIPPDEETHLGIIELYSKTPLFIQDSPDSYRFGLVTRVPWLYHFAMGKLLALNIFGIESYLYLRLWNVVVALLTLLVAYRLAALLTDNRLVRLLFLVMATNTLMWTFLSASVSYDNLVNLLAVLGVYLLIAFFLSNRPDTLLAFLLVILLGTLTKLTFLPLALILLAVLGFERRQSLAADGRRLMELLRGRQPQAWVVVTLALLAAVATLALYGQNLVRYGRVNPSCGQVLNLDQCMENRIFARNWIVSQYRLDKLSYEEAVQATGRIAHRGDREHALRLLGNERWFKSTRPEPLNVVDYMKAVWGQAMKPSIFGIQAHQSMLKSPNALLAYSLIFLVGFILWVRAASRKGPERMWFYLAGASILYFVFLVGYVNYRGYLASHAPLLGVQGRYAFPVLLPAFLVLARSLLDRFGKGGQVAILIVVAVVFILGDLPYFKSHASETWFAQHEAESVQPPGLE